MQFWKVPSGQPPIPPAKMHARNTVPKVLAFVFGGVISVLLVSPLLCGDLCYEWPILGVSVASYLALHWQWEPVTSHAFPPALESFQDFSWEKIKPSAVLNWVKCYQENECARLEVPLDYGDPGGDQAAVALLKVKAKVSPRSKAYGGPVLLNPGGPGASGVQFAKMFGKKYQQILGNEYDVIGFDPRGVGETTPAVSVFPDQVAKAYWAAGLPPLPNTIEALSRAISRAEMFNELIKVRAGRAAQHSSTATVARDMLSITKAHGRKRLQYWGISYGTVLGATFAAMFPDNVERLVIDGVVDFDDYYSGAWSKSLVDTDKELDFLYSKCASAGSACPLHANSSALVKQRVDSIFAKIKTAPVAVVHGADYGLVDYRILKTELFMSLYHPYTLFLPFAQALASLESDDGHPALAIWKKVLPMPNCDTSRPPVVGEWKEAMLAVMCGEAKDVRNTLPDIVDHLRDQYKISIFADIWTDSMRTSCAGWRVRAKDVFTGPFTTNTSFPLLIIGNTLDPVTPLVGAQKAARGFGNSVLLTINTAGHTSLGATSACANKIVRNYFAEGKLPQDGTVCEVEDALFEEKPDMSQNITAEDVELIQLQVSRLLSEVHVSLP